MMQEMQATIDLAEFWPRTIVIKLGKHEFILKKPNVEQFLSILERTKDLGQDYRVDMENMTSILCDLLVNTGFLWARKRTFRKILKSLDETGLMTVRNKSFLELWVITAEDVIQMEAMQSPTPIDL